MDNSKFADTYTDECISVFVKGGVLESGAVNSGKIYEERLQQQEMTHLIADALKNGKNLCIEAPTGIGKSFAYLVPLILRAKYKERPAIISTETINLQEQLIKKDIPYLKEILNVNFQAVIAKGRGNYICQRRFAMLANEEQGIFISTPTLKTELERLSLWISGGCGGSYDTLNFNIDPVTWRAVCCEASNCHGPKCEFFRNCFYFKARREWENSDIIVANHALFFSDLAMRCGELSTGTLLPNYGAVLIDEAHTIEDNAAEHMGLYLSKGALLSDIHKLFNPEYTSGLLMHPGINFGDLRASTVEIIGEVHAFFAPYENLLSNKNDTTYRLSNAAPVSPNLLSQKLLDFSFRIGEIIEANNDEKNDNFYTELKSCQERISNWGNSLIAFQNRELAQSVYYIERLKASVVLRAVPLNVADILRKILFNGENPVILCSATLAINGSFDFYVKRTGFGGGITKYLTTPFSSEQAQVFISKKVPDPSSSEFDNVLVEEVFHYLELSNGRAFILFTNYTSLRFCAQRLRIKCELRGWHFFVQGEGMSRSAMLDEFKKCRNGVLLGTDSFWTGVDVPGDALSNVIITKLPFASPGHPITAAREELISQTGKNSFTEYSLPVAVLKFRQGIGRLIRSRKDSGIIVIFDRRIYTKRYGKVFLDSIPYKIVSEK